MSSDLWNAVMVNRKQHFILQRDERLPRRSLQGARGQSKRTRESQQVKKTFSLYKMPSQLIVLFTSLPSLNSISRNLLLMPGSSFSWSCSSSQSSKWLKKYLEIPSMINRSLNDYISMVQDLDSSWQGGIVSRRTTVNVNVDRFHSSYLQSCFFFSTDSKILF